MISKAISDYYDLSLICEDDIIVVALLIGLFDIRVNTKILNDLEGLKLEKYGKAMEMLLECDIKALSGFKIVLNGIARDFENSKVIKTISKDTNLLDFCEEL